MKQKLGRLGINGMIVTLAAYAVVSIICLSQIVAAEEYFGFQQYGNAPLVSISKSKIVAKISEPNFIKTEKSFVINDRTRFFDEDGNLVANLRSNGEINEDALREFLKPGMKVTIEVTKIDGEIVAISVKKTRFK